MTTPAEDIATYLSSNGAGTLAATVGWGIFYSTEPAHTNNLITIYDTGGSDWATWNDMTSPTIQIRVKGRGYSTAFSKAAQCRDLIMKARGFTIGDYRYGGFSMISDVAKIGRDDKDKDIFTVNIQLMRDYTP